jgi:serine/threonine-protein kinase SRPK3
MVFEILGVNLLEIMKRYDYKGVPIPIVRRMAKQILLGLDYLHRFCKIIHTDLKPENVIVSLTRAELEEIDQRGQISNMNRNVKTEDVEVLFKGKQTT